MTKTKKLLLLAAAMIAAGLVLFGIGIVLGGTPGFVVDPKGFHTLKTYSRDPHSLEKTKLDKFTSLEIDTENADIEMIPSDGYYIEYYTDGGYGDPTYSVVNGRLKFSQVPDHQFLYTFFSVSPSFGSVNKSYVKIYVPADAVLEAATLTADEGDITLTDLNADKLTLDSEYGNITADRLVASDCNIYTEDGTVTVKELQADRFEADCEYGEMSFGSINGSKGEITTSDGHLKADSVKLASLILDSEYGNVTIGILNADTSEINTEDGDLSIGVGKIKTFHADSEYGTVSLKLSEDLSAYNMDLFTEYGVIMLPDNSKTSSHSDGASYKSQTGKSQTITVQCEDGDIILSK